MSTLRWFSSLALVLSLPAELAIRSRPSSKLALQVSTIASAGQCEAAILTGDRLRAIDTDLYERLVESDAAFARCLATSSR